MLTAKGLLKLVGASVYDKSPLFAQRAFKSLIHGVFYESLTGCDELKFLHYFMSRQYSGDETQFNAHLADAGRAATNLGSYAFL